MARVDPYRTDKKPKGLIQCRECQAVSSKGRWLPHHHTQSKNPYGVIHSQSICPACKQLKDHYAMGVIELSGRSYQEKKSEVIGNLRNLELIARKRNDQHRILWMNDQKTMTKIYVTLPELARSMGRSLERSFHGKTEYIHSSEEPFLRVRWKSDLPHFRHKAGSAVLKQTAQEVLIQKTKTKKSKSRQLRKRGSP